MKRKIAPPVHVKDEARVIERPDGFYWQAMASGKTTGPFDTLLEATLDLQSAGDAEGEGQSYESLEEAEASLDISDWIDPDTGSPAEETAPRLERSLQTIAELWPDREVAVCR